MPSWQDQGAVGLLERDSALHRVGLAVDGLVAGRGSVILVTGDAGIGKSALLRAAIEAASAAGCGVFSGAGDELSVPFSLRPLLDAFGVRESSLDARRVEIARVLRGAYTGAGESGAAQAAAGLLLSLIDDLCAAGPTVLLIDDLQWADETTIMVWHRLARTVAQRGLLLIGAMRPLPRREELRALQRAVGPEDIVRLTPLSPDAVQRLVTEFASARPAPNLAALAAGAAGNPLYLTELLAALNRGGLLVVADETASLVDDSVPRDLADAITARLDFLPRETRKMMQAASLLGNEFSAVDLAVIMDQQVTELLAAFDDAREAGVLVASGESKDALSFRHPLIRTALYHELPRTVRVALHCEAARMLYGAGASDEAVARQLLAAGAERQVADWQLDWLAEAAATLINTAPELVVSLVEPLMPLLSNGSRHRDQLVCVLAEAWSRVGRAADAERIARNNTALITDPHLQVDLFDTLSRSAARPATLEQVGAELERVAAGRDELFRGRLLALAARAHLRTGDGARADRIAQASLAAARRVDDNWAIALVHDILGGCRLLEQRVEAALAEFEKGLVATEDDHSRADLRVHLLYSKAYVAAALNKADEARQGFALAQRLAEQSGNLSRLTQVQAGLVDQLFMDGHWDEALAECEHIDGHDHDDRSVCVIHSTAAIILMHRDDQAGADRRLAAAAGYADKVARTFMEQWGAAGALDRERTGDIRGALEFLTAHLDQAATSEQVLPDSVRLALMLGDVASAAAATECAGNLQHIATMPQLQGIIWHCRGLLEADPDQLLMAAERYAATGRPLPSGQATEAAALLLAQRGDVEQARRHGAEAVTIYSSLGANWDVARIRAALRRSGIRLHARTARAKAMVGWEALTGTENQVVDLLAKGLSNPQVASQLLLSRRTVETYVSSVLRKLSLQSRVDIALAAATRESRQ